MQFSTGRTVVHPHHGPATITAITDRVVAKATVSYLELKIHSSDLTISIPASKAEEIGLREVYTANEISELLDVLRAATEHEEETWSRRFKDNQEKLRQGDLLVTAAVVRDLSRRDSERGLSSGEKQMLRTARQPILAELGLGLSISEEEAEKVLDEAILSPEASKDEYVPAAAAS